MREKSPRRADAFTAEAVTLNFSKCLNTFAHLLMKYQKLSPPLAALMFEYLKSPAATSDSVNGTRSQSLAVSADNLPVTTVSIYRGEDAAIENAAGLRVNSNVGAIRTAQIALEKISDLSDRTDVDYLSCSMRLKPLNDDEAIEKGLNEFRENHPELNGADIIFGLVAAGIDAAPPTFAGKLHSIWDQTLAGNDENRVDYGKPSAGESLSEYAGDDDGAGTRTAHIFAAFAASFGAESKANIIVVKTDFQNARLADAVRYVFDAAEKAGKIAVVNLNLDDSPDVREGRDDFSRFVNQTRGANNFVITIVGNDSERKIEKTAAIAPGKFLAAKFFFVVPSNTQPNSPPEVVLHGSAKSGDTYEISILSPDGGVTRSTQQTTGDAGNPTLFGDYGSSKALLTKPSVMPDGEREFFIDLRATAGQPSLTGGTWKLNVTNTGETEIIVGVSISVPPGFNDAKFI